MKKRLAILLTVCLLLSFAGCGRFSKEATLTVYLDEALTEAQSKAIGTRLNHFPSVTNVTYISSQEAWESFMEAHEDPASFAGTDASTLRSRFVVTTQKKDLEALTAQILELEGVADVKSSLLGG